MTTITIPPEALEAAARALAADAKLNWDDIPQTHNILRSEARAAFLAMLNAWPGARDSGITIGEHSTRIYILPLSRGEE